MGTAAINMGTSGGWATTQFGAHGGGNWDRRRSLVLWRASVAVLRSKWLGADCEARFRLKFDALHPDEAPIELKNRP
jgi:hypothetical protein